MMKKVTLNEFTDKLASASIFRDNNACDNKVSRNKMMKMIERVAEGELTERQKQCLFMYYEKGMKMGEISDSLGICISCVSRHIKKAKLRIQRTLMYYYFTN